MSKLTARIDTLLEKIIGEESETSKKIPVIEFKKHQIFDKLRSNVKKYLLRPVSDVIRNSVNKMLKHLTFLPTTTSLRGFASFPYSNYGNSFSESQDYIFYIDALIKEATSGEIETLKDAPDVIKNLFKQHTKRYTVRLGKDELLANQFGMYIVPTAKAFIKSKFAIAKRLQERFPELKESFTRLYTLKPFVATPVDMFAKTTRKFRESVDLPPSVDESELLRFSLFLKFIFNDISYRPSVSNTSIKNDGSIGCMRVLDIDGVLISVFDSYNSVTKFATVKTQIIDQIANDFDDFINCVSNLDMKTLLIKYSAVNISRVVFRYQEDDDSKARKVTGVDIYFSDEEILYDLDYKKELKDAINDGLLDATILDVVNGARQRTAFADEFIFSFYPNLVMPIIRNHYKNKFPKVFKFASEDELEELFTNKYRELLAKFKQVVICTLDFEKFDHTLTLSMLKVFHDAMTLIDEKLGLFLKIASVCPIAIKNAGWSKIKNAWIDDVIIGDPLDPNTWFYGQGKSGDADVADRCKLACSFVMATIILDILNLEFNESNLQRLFNWELDIVFMNLGDNNIVLIPDQYKQAFEHKCKTNTTLRPGIEPAPIFGGKHIVYEHDKIQMRTSPLSFAVKLLCSEYSYNSKHRRGWTLGFRSRYIQAIREYIRYGSPELIDILHIINECIAETYGSDSLINMAYVYAPAFNRWLDNQNDLMHALNAFNEDPRVLEIMLDPDKVLWKYEPEEFGDAIRTIIDSMSFNRLSTRTAAKIFS